MTEQASTDRDPRHHTRQIRQRLQEMTQHLREDVGKVDDPQARALFETTAEVLLGLDHAYEHYEQRSEEAWR